MKNYLEIDSIVDRGTVCRFFVKNRDIGDIGAKYLKFNVMNQDSQSNVMIYQTSSKQLNSFLTLKSGEMANQESDRQYSIYQ